MELKHQYSTNGQHRIVSLDIAGFLKESGEWTHYNNIATFVTHSSVIYACVTKYFEGGAVKPDRIYQLSPTGFASEKPYSEIENVAVKEREWKPSNDEQSDKRMSERKTYLKDRWNELDMQPKAELSVKEFIDKWTKE